MPENDPLVAWLEEPTPENLKEAADEYGVDEIAEYRDKFEVLCSMAAGYNETVDPTYNSTEEDSKHVHNYWIDVDDDMNVFQGLEDIQEELED